MKRLLILFLVIVIVAVAAVLAMLALDSPPGSVSRPGGTSLQVVNNSSQTICKVQATQILGEGSLKASTFEGREIEPGKWLYYELEPGHYDLAALNCAGDLLDDEHNIEIIGAYPWTITD